MIEAAARTAPAQLHEREILVVDSAGTAIAGASLVCGAVFDADGGVRAADRHVLTGSDGRACVRVQDGRSGVSALAPGFRLRHSNPPDPPEPWVIRLQRAQRLEISLQPGRDLCGYHVEVELPHQFAGRDFYQSRYVWTPGRCVEGTRGFWQAHDRGSTWSLVPAAGGRAVVDQLEGAGTVRVELVQFDQVLDQRELELQEQGGTQQIAFEVPPPRPMLRVVVQEAARRPLSGVSVRMAPYGGHVIVDSPASQYDGFPHWAPRHLTDAAGRVDLPRPPSDRVRVLFHSEGCADRVLTIAELEAAAGVVVLQPACVVRLEALDRDGVALYGGSTTGGELYAEPSVHLGHDVWRGASRRGHPAAGGEDLSIPWFLFADLPAGSLTFRFTYLADDDVLVHDTRNPWARFVASEAVLDLHMGK